MKNLENVLRAIKDLCNGEDDKEETRKQRMNEILTPLLQFLEAITTLDLTKDNVHSTRIYEAIISLINEKIHLQNRSYMVNIVFNLHLKLSQDSKYRQVAKEFVRELYRTYCDYRMENSLHKTKQISGEVGDLLNQEDLHN